LKTDEEDEQLPI